MTCTPLEVLGSKMLLGLVRPQEIPDAATDALEHGCDSPSLRGWRG